MMMNLVTWLFLASVVSRATLRAEICSTALNVLLFLLVFSSGRAGSSWITEDKRPAAERLVCSRPSL